MPSDFRWHSLLVSAGYLPDTKDWSLLAVVLQSLLSTSCKN